jgi:ferredoxin
VCTRDLQDDGSSGNGSGEPSTRPKSYAELTTAEWQERYEKDGTVDLWLQEEFNSGSRLVVSLPQCQCQRQLHCMAWVDVMTLQTRLLLGCSAATHDWSSPRSPSLFSCHQGGSAVYRGGVAGQRSGEGPGRADAQSFKVKIINHYAEQEVEVEVPEDRCGSGQQATASQPGLYKPL